MKHNKTRVRRKNSSILIAMTCCSERWNLRPFIILPDYSFYCFNEGYMWQLSIHAPCVMFSTSTMNNGILQTDVYWSKGENQTNSSSFMVWKQTATQYNHVRRQHLQNEHNFFFCTRLIHFHNIADSHINFNSQFVSSLQFVVWNLSRQIVPRNLILCNVRSCFLLKLDQEKARNAFVLFFLNTRWGWSATDYLGVKPLPCRHANKHSREIGILMM